MKTTRTGIALICGALLTAALCGCSSSNPAAPTLNANGEHPATWYTDHRAAYQERASQCYQCHGTDLKGGISKVSCYSADRNGRSCHANGPSNHPAGWNLPANHGVHAKALVSGADGFSACQACHGTLFTGGTSGTSCFGCHGVSAPHPAKPWRGGTYTHTSTDSSNAATCALCHTGGANLSPALQQASYATGTPGCFNNTLCHGTVGHVSGYGSPTVHAPVAKGKPSATTGFASCKTCHGNDYKGTSSTPTCFTCHGVNAPHAKKPWRGGSYTHTTTDPDNASVCADCHTAGANLSAVQKRVNFVTGTPGCFNNTLCHGTTGHPDGWVNSANHGASAKDVPGSTAGFNYCRNCHGAGFNGGTAQTCLNNASCHGAGVAAPHSPKPWLSQRSHTTTNEGNAVMCNLCHNNGTNSSLQPNRPAATGTTPGCYNSTLCHGPIGHEEHFAAVDLHGADAKATPSDTTGFAYCKNCHGTDFAGGSAHTCLNTSGCHGVGVFAPHSPKPWRGGTYTHTSTDQGNAGICAACHTAGANLTASLRSSSYATGTAGCFNNTLCHAQPSGHPTGWGAATSHGPHAKAKVSGSDGFSACQSCHGSGFAGGTGPTCLNTTGCHGVGVFAPHSPKPWRGGAYSHTTTDSTNAATCALCHTGGANLTPSLRLSVYATGTPGCFNSTLCHGQPSGHPAGWAAPTSHGVTAKAVSGSTSGFPSCEQCHGSTFAGGTGPTCLRTAGCHGATVSAPHSPKPWRGGTYTHTTTDATNAVACAICHTAGANLSAGLGLPSYASGTAGCFNSTLCHGSSGHPAVGGVAWSGSPHGQAAKGILTTGTGMNAPGFDSCSNTTCHGYAFRGVGSAPSCFSTSFGSVACHPRASHYVPWLASTGAVTGKRHSGTGSQYAQVCGRCHQGGQKLTVAVTNVPATVGCFNSTLCHGAISGHAVPYPDHRNATGIPNVCQTCHGAQLQGNTATGAPACSTCHTALAAGAYPVLGQCVSCHGKPPATGRHVFHATGEGKLGTNCDYCHTGVGSGSTNHGSRSAPLVVFSAIAGTRATYNSTNRTCSNINCHEDAGVHTWGR
jgi:hypothetical protein